VIAGRPSLADAFTRFLGSDPDRIHAAAHSHHPWPDVTLAAHRQAWIDAAAHHDAKWEVVMGAVLPAARAHIAGLLTLPDPASVAVATNTHELVLRILSCLPVPARVLTTDAEFHSFTRQSRRLVEAGQVVLDVVAAEPFESFGPRLAGAAARGGHDLVFVSHVLFSSGYVVDDLAEVCAAVASPETFVVIDGYHAFMAMPVDLSAIADRAFYLAGGYKYAMAGEGACFLHCPPGYGLRPVNTGWFAAFEDLEAPGGSPGEHVVGYPPEGMRFMGSTFDPSAWYRFNAVQDWLAGLGVTPADIHAHVRGLQQHLLDRLDALDLLDLGRRTLLPQPDAPDRGNFLSFRTGRAPQLQARLLAAGIVTDHRADRLRVGLGVYHDEAVVDRLVDRLTGVLR
jgi:kynureninase